MEKELVSIIVPVYNACDYLDACVGSILHQTYASFEAYLVDDGSTDGSGDICDAWAEMDCRIKVLHKDNGGGSSARNMALDYVIGDYIAFVDADDMIEKDYLSRLMSLLKDNDADIAGCRYYREPQSLLERLDHKYDFLTDGRGYLIKAYNDFGTFCPVWGKVYKVSLWKTLRFPVGKICEDAFVVREYSFDCKRIVWCSDRLYFYRMVNNSIIAECHKKFNRDSIEWLEVDYKCYFDLKQVELMEMAAKGICFYIVEYFKVMSASEKNEYKKKYTYYLKTVLNGKNVSLRAKVKYFFLGVLL